MNFEEVKEYLEHANWTWAKTYEKFAPHWWIVKRDKNFVEVVRFIRENGICRKWYNTVGMYLDIGEYSYWALGKEGHQCMIEKCSIINRKIIENDDKENEMPKEEFDKLYKAKQSQRKLFS